MFNFEVRPRDGRLHAGSRLLFVLLLELLLRFQLRLLGSCLFGHQLLDDLLHHLLRDQLLSRKLLRHLLRRDQLLGNQLLYHQLLHHQLGRQLLRNGLLGGGRLLRDGLLGNRLRDGGLLGHRLLLARHRLCRRGRRSVGLLLGDGLLDWGRLRRGRLLLAALRPVRGRILRGGRLLRRLLRRGLVGH